MSHDHSALFDHEGLQRLGASAWFSVADSVFEVNAWEAQAADLPAIDGRPCLAPSAWSWWQRFLAWRPSTPRRNPPTRPGSPLTRSVVDYAASRVRRLWREACGGAPDVDRLVARIDHQVVAEALLVLGRGGAR